ncbi:MAG: 6,7-dimethyl-8-ribityllumazine synthase [Deltaproteobacteria bacterium]|nr:6,7-dimethyl-8-ribityllumazine synthase [Deltaproteobacteria bacterium]
MPNVFEGKISGEGKRFAVIVSRFNDFISHRLVNGALDALGRHGTDDENIDVVKVPGCFEIPFMAKKMAQSGRYNAVICLGAVIRGSTPHFEYISVQVSRGIASAGVESGVPVIFGVITADTLEQAIERAGSKAGNKGWDAAVAAMEMANLMDSVPTYT